MANRFMRRPNGTTGSIPHNILAPVTVIVAGAQVDANVFIADADYEVDRVQEVHSVAGAASSTLDVKKCTGTTAPASGTSVLSSTFALDSTANTVVSKTLGSGLTATQADRRLTTGDRLALDWTGTVTAYVGTVAIYLKRIQSANAVR